jgi:diacylglycerol O-acyltransferase / wax synthase
MPRNHHRLSSIDASFLAIENSTAHTHIAAVVGFEGQIPDYEDLHVAIESRLHLLPRFRQRLHSVPMLHPWPVLVNDPFFNIAFHVRGTALPAPGSEEQLNNLVARILSSKIKRDHPLWEIWFVDNIDDGFAAVLKVHHALLDGISLVDAAVHLLDHSQPLPDTERLSWLAAPLPTEMEMFLSSLERNASASVIAIHALGAAIRRPMLTASSAWSSTAKLGSAMSARLRRAPKALLGRLESPHRRFTSATIELDDVNAIRRLYGATINDVALTVVSLALGRYLRHSGDRTERSTLSALVPKSVRSPEEKDQLGNRIAGMVVPLPVYVSDPEEALESIHETMTAIKKSRQSEGMTLISRVGEVFPARVFVETARVANRRRPANLVVSNVPGPSSTCHFLGRQMESFRFVPTADQAVNVGVTSYNRKLEISVVADYDTFDVERFAADLNQSMDQLLIAIRRRFNRATAVSGEGLPSESEASTQGSPDDYDDGF